MIFYLNKLILAINTVSDIIQSPVGTINFSPLKENRHFDTRKIKEDLSLVQNFNPEGELLITFLIFQTYLLHIT